MLKISQYTVHHTAATAPQLTSSDEAESDLAVSDAIVRWASRDDAGRMSRKGGTIWRLWMATYAVRYEVSGV